MQNLPDLPEKQILNYVIDRCLGTYDWIKELQDQNSKNALVYLRSRILCDAFSAYLVTLVDGGEK